MRLPRHLDSPLAAAVVAVACYAAFVIGLWNTRDRDISRFIVLGSITTTAADLPRGVAILPDNWGYDGAAFYRLALDPFTNEQKDFGIWLDMPAYRHQRIGYPFIVWALSLGRPEAVPALLVLVNLGAIAFLGFCGALLARHAGVHALWGILFPLYPGFIHSVSRDLAEPVACAFALAAVVAIARQRHIAGSVLLCCAVLTRETFLLLVVAYGVQWIRRRSSIRPVVFIAPLLVYGVWQLALLWNWGVSPTSAGAHQLDPAIPFADYWNVLVSSSSLRRIHRLHFSEALYLGVVTALAIAAWRASKAELAWKAGWLAQLILVSTLVPVIWREDVSYMRVLSEFHLLSAAIILTGARWTRWTLLLTTSVLWYYLATHLVKYG